MSIFVKLKTPAGKDVWVNPDHVEYVIEAGEILTGGPYVQVNMVSGERNLVAGSVPAILGRLALTISDQIHLDEQMTAP